MPSNLLFDPRDKLVSSNRFIVSLGVGVFSFSKVSNITTEIDVDTILEGGNNDTMHIVQKQKQKPDTLVLEKGARARLSDPLYSLLAVGLSIEMATIIVLNHSVTPQKAFYFKRGVITKRVLSTLDAMSSEILIETMEIAHTGLHEIPIPGY